MRRLREMARDERGMTLVELLVATAAGMVVMAGIATAMIVTTREVQRVSTHVEANRQSRLAMSKIVNQLHSACLTYDFAPIESESSSTLLSFLHQAGSTASLIPVLSKISLSGTTLSQSDYPLSSGTTPTDWIFATIASKTTPLLTGVSQSSASVPVFSYYGYTEGAISAPFSTSPSLGTTAAEKTVQVNVSFKAAPRTIGGDASASTAIQSSTLLRMSPASFETSSINKPCQ